jgi:hypothetical protein
MTQLTYTNFVHHENTGRSVTLDSETFAETRDSPRTVQSGVRWTWQWAYVCRIASCLWKDRRLQERVAWRDEGIWIGSGPRQWQRAVREGRSLSDQPIALHQVQGRSTQGYSGETVEIAALFQLVQQQSS